MTTETPLSPAPSQEPAGWLARARAWFAAAAAKVKAAAAAPATPQAQPAAGPDLVDTAPPQPVVAPGKFRVWLSAAWAWLRNAAAWLTHKPVFLGVLVLLALLIAAGALWPRLAPVQSSPPPEQTTAAVPAVNPLAELVTRLDAQDTMLAELQGQVAELQGRPQASRSAQAQCPAAAGPAPASQPQRQPAAWGPTDLDRAISNFTPPTTFGASK